MSKPTKSLFETFITLIAIILVFGAGYYLGNTKTDESKTTRIESDSDDLHLPGEVEKRVITVEDVESKLDEISELSTYAGNYTVTLGKDATRHIFDKIALPGTTNSIEITCSGVVKVGYDMSKIKVKVDDDKIYISIPEAKLNDNYVIWDSIECKEANNILNPIEFSQYEEIIKEIEEKGLADVESQGIYDLAEQNLMKVMNGFLSEFVDYEIVYM